MLVMKGRLYDPQLDVYNIKEAALLIGVHRDTIIYWEENNLIPLAMRNPKNNYRAYSVSALKEIATRRQMYSLDIDVQIRKLEAGALHVSQT